MTTAPKAARRFDVGLSYPGEHRPFVQEVAERLAATLSQDRVLYDKFHDVEFARPNLSIFLPRLYREQSELIVAFLCPEYAAKRWCQLEWRHISQLIASLEADRIMFLSFGDPGDLSELGVLPGDGFIDIISLAPETVADKVLKRLRLNQGRVAPTPDEPPALSPLPEPEPLHTPAETLLRLWADVNGSWIRVQYFPARANEEAFHSVSFRNVAGSYPANAALRFWGSAPLDNEAPPGPTASTAKLRHPCFELQARLGSPKSHPVTVGFRVIDRYGRHWSHARGDSYELQTMNSTNWTAMKKVELAGKTWTPFEADGTPHSAGLKPDFSAILAVVVEVGGEINPSRPSAGSGVVHLKGFRLCDR